jgi:hypothetical protein
MSDKKETKQKPVTVDDVENVINGFIESMKTMPFQEMLIAKERAKAVASKLK